MAAQLRVVRRRIRTVQSTQKITRAFELISASRVVRAQQRVEAARPYTNQVTQALTSVANTEVTISHPLLEPRAEVKAAGVLVVTSDRGLAGPYNANVLRTAAELMARLQADGIEPRLYVTGRKGVGYYRFRRRELAENWTGLADRPDVRRRQAGRRHHAGGVLLATYDPRRRAAHGLHRLRVGRTQRPRPGASSPWWSRRPRSRPPEGPSRCTSTSPAPRRSGRPAAPVRRGPGVHGSCWRRRPPSTPPGAGR